MIDIDDEQPAILDRYVVVLRPREGGEPHVIEVDAQDQSSACALALLRVDGDPSRFCRPEVEPAGGTP